MCYSHVYLGTHGHKIFQCLNSASGLAAYIHSCKPIRLYSNNFCVKFLYVLLLPFINHTLWKTDSACFFFTVFFFPVWQHMPVIIWSNRNVLKLLASVVVVYPSVDTFWCTYKNFHSLLFIMHHYRKYFLDITLHFIVDTFLARPEMKHSYQSINTQTHMLTFSLIAVQWKCTEWCTCHPFIKEDMSFCQNSIDL